MVHARIEMTQDLDGHPVVLALFDVGTVEIAAAAHAVAAVKAERFRVSALATDDVLAMRELTALVDELTSLAAHEAATTVVMSPARLNALRHALEEYVHGRDEAEWLREEDREPLAVLRSLLDPLADLSAEAMRAALSAPQHCR